MTTVAGTGIAARQPVAAIPPSSWSIAVLPVISPPSEKPDAISFRTADRDWAFRQARSSGLPAQTLLVGLGVRDQRAGCRTGTSWQQQPLIMPARAGSAGPHDRNIYKEAPVKTLARLASLLAVPALLLLPAAGAALADGATVTHQVVMATSTIAFTDPCTSQTGTAAISYTAVFEQTDRPVGTVSLLSNVTGDFVLALDSGPVITGHFVSTFVLGGGQNTTISSILTAHGQASDGTLFALHYQVITAENGHGILIVDLTRC